MTIRIKLCWQIVDTGSVQKNRVDKTMVPAITFWIK